MSTHKVASLNGINVDQLHQTIEALKLTPELGRFQFRARNEWMDGGHCRTHIRSFYGAGKEDESRTDEWVFDADEPPVLLGENRGANPVEYALVALASCVTTTMVVYAAAEGIKLHRLESELEGDLDVRGFTGVSTDVRRGYENIRITVHVEADAPREKLEHLVEMGKAYSPVFDIVSNPTKVDVRLA